MKRFLLMAGVFVSGLAAAGLAVVVMMAPTWIREWNLRQQKPELETAVTVTEEEQPSEEDIEQAQREKFADLLAQNPDVVGWITIPDTPIDLPVMQTTDNEFYLRHGLDKEYDNLGLPFVDYECDLKNSRNLIIYGHNMGVDDTDRFSSLQEYRDTSYYAKHPVIQLDIPALDGYEFIVTGDLQINDGWVYVAVKPAEGTRVVGLNYYDEVNKVQVCEKEMVVDADAIHVNTNDIPALDGYEFIVTGDLQINDGWVYVGVKPLETKTVGLNFFDEENYEQVCEVEVEVPYNAIHLNTSEISKYLPEGYELIELGDLSIRDGWIYVGVKCNWTLKIYWAIDNEQASFANGNDNAWTQELTWMHADDEMAMPEINVNDGYKLNGWSVSGESGEFWTADLASVKELSKKCVKDENGGYISITANVVKADEATSGNTNTVTASSDDSSDEVVKAEAPADNSTKILPQTGNQGVVSPVSFVVVLCAALAGAAVYLFAIRKKLN